MELEVSGRIGAERYERTGGRTAHRNGYRHRRWDTRVGSTSLRIPKVTRGSYFPSFLEPQRRSERARVSVIQEAGAVLLEQHEEWARGRRYFSQE